MFAAHGTSTSSATRTPEKRTSSSSSSSKSPLSILEQWQKDARGAVEDAYANYVLGDDTGESARLVLVANPSDDLLPLEQQKSSKNEKQKHPPHVLLNEHPSTTPKPPWQNPNNLLLLRKNNNNRKTKHHKQDPTSGSSFATCGISFVEINGRAYVHDLDPNSEAYQSGVRPKDCVQYAAVLAAEWEDPLGSDFDPISTQALEREDTGQRITYEELQRVILQGSGLFGDLNNANPHELYHRTPSGNFLGPTPPPLPTTIRIGKNLNNPCGGLLPGDDFDDASTLRTKEEQPSASTRDPRPIVMIFRRTKQRPPRAWNVWPNYRLDDECDVACTILEQLAITTKTERYPDDETVSLDDDHSRKSSHRINKVLFSSNDKGKYIAEENENVEASTLRGMIAKAKGLAFVRTNKVVFGVGLHGGSGIVLSRLKDGTWSAPSLIGMGGLGVGLQVGLEVASYVFVLQTEEALEHFCRGGSFALGANVGAALANMGREAVGAASVSGALCGIAQPLQLVKEDEYNYENDEEDIEYFELEEVDDEYGSPSRRRRRRRRRRRDFSCRAAPHPSDCNALPGETSGLAPMVAYAKSEGLYLGVSLEGSRMFSRTEANAKAYQYYHRHKAVTARDILKGKIGAKPFEAEPLYELLHAIELAHDWASLPAVPRSSKDCYGRPWEAGNAPPSGIADNNDDDDDDLERFSRKFKHLLLGGVTVTRLDDRPKRRQRRTLWLSSQNQPEGSLRLGFVSKLYSSTAQRKHHLSASIINDYVAQKNSGAASVVSEMEADELTLDSALLDNQSLLTTTGTLQERVELSKKLSIDLIDVTRLSQSAPSNIRLARGERDRVICLESSDHSKLIFVGKTPEETRLLFCGLTVLLEQETERMGVRGGKAIPSKNRGITSALRNKGGKVSPSVTKHQAPQKKDGSGYASSDIDDTDDGLYDPSDHYHQSTPNAVFPRDSLPEGWKSWGRLPGRSYMRAQSTSADDGFPTYAHGQLLIRDVCKNVVLPLPLPLCRVLLLDSSSPVISKWESERGDMDFERTPWTFPPATPREMEQFQSEHQLIASGSMCGAHRTISYERYRNGRPVRLSETHIVDSDDSDKLAFQVNERLPRRGFSIKVKILLRAVDNGSACEATVLGEIRPVGKNMSDPSAVHKALLKVLDELKHRYGTDCVGLLAGFVDVVENMAKDEATSPGRIGKSRRKPTSSWGSSTWEEKKESESATRSPKKMLGKTSVVKFEDVMNADVGIADVPDPRFAQESRPGNKSASDYKSTRSSKQPLPIDDDDACFASSSSDPVTIEVKPLPKIRLSLMPSPREEDEENLDDEGEPPSRKSSQKSSGRSSSKRSSKKSSRNSSNSKRKA